MTELTTIEESNGDPEANKRPVWLQLNDVTGLCPGCVKNLCKFAPGLMVKNHNVSSYLYFS